MGPLAINRVGQLCTVTAKLSVFTYTAVHCLLKCGTHLMPVLIEMETLVHTRFLNRTLSCDYYKIGIIVRYVV